MNNLLDKSIKIKNKHPFILSLVLYVIACYFIYGHYVIGLGLNKSTIGYSLIYNNFIWNIAWLNHSLSNFSNPFYTKYLWYKSGVSLSWNALFLPAYGIISSAVIKIVSPIAWANIIYLLQPVLASFFAFILLFKVTKSFSGSFAGGFIYGFSSYMIEELLQANIGYMTIFIIPVVALLCYLLFIKEISYKKAYILLSISLLFQAGTSLEVLLSILVFSFVTFIVSLFYIKEDGFLKLRGPIIVLAASYFTAIAMISPWLYSMLYQHYFSGDKFGWNGTNLVSMILPSQLNAYGYGQNNLWSSHWFQNSPFTSGYIGIPILAFILYFFVSRKYDHYNLIKTLLILFFIMTVGRYLYFTTPYPSSHYIPAYMPWYPTRFIPIIKDMQPHRFIVYLNLVIGLMIALYASLEKNRTKKLLLLLMFMISLLPAQPWIKYVSHDLQLPKFFDYENIIRVIPKNSVVLIYDHGGYDYGMLYQAMDKLWYKLAQGNDQGPGTIPTNYAGWNAIQNLNNPNFQDAMRQYIKDHNVNYVFVGDKESQFISKVSPICVHSAYEKGVFVCLVE